MRETCSSPLILALIAFTSIALCKALNLKSLRIWGQSAVASSNESNVVPLSFRALVKRCHRAVVAGVVIPCLCMCVCVIVCIAVDPETQYEHH